ncbi:MAG: NIPSNAP family protein [Ramlibacter sp.]
MLVDERTYLIRPGCLQQYLARHCEVALPLMREYLGEPLAYFTSGDGVQDEFVHLWAYADAADRETRRAKMYADPRWLTYRKETGERGWVVLQRNRLLTLVEGVGRIRGIGT